MTERKSRAAPLARTRSAAVSRTRPLSKVARYRAQLRALPDWDGFLLAHSGLPGPRANLELVWAVADEGDARLFKRYASLDPEQAPATSRTVFLAVCGAVGLGRLLAEGDSSGLETLERLASDPRWRVREGVAMALQRLGAKDMDALLGIADEWSRGGRLQQRAAAAAICEPALLKHPEQAQRALQILDAITASIADAGDSRTDEFRVLRQALGYCWSVAVAALPAAGMKMMERWLAIDDTNVRWIMRENLTKARLARAAPDWVARWTLALTRSGQ